MPPMICFNRLVVCFERNTGMKLNQAIGQLMDKVSVSDSRVEGRCTYPLLPALFSIIFAWCAGAGCATKAADFIRFNQETLKRIIPGFGPCGSMSHDTILRLLKMVKFSELNLFLREFAELLCSHAPNGYRVIAVDGQTPRSIVYEPEEGQKSPQDRRTYEHQYYVTMYDATNKMTLAQEDVYEKENENKACIRLSSLFSLEGCVVTSDALNCTRAVARAVIDNNGDYFLALKSNHKNLCRETKACFENSELLDEVAVHAQSETELAHGRVESRTVIALPASAVKARILGDWKEDARSIFFVRTCSYDKKYQQYKEPIIRYFISSLDFDDPKIADYGLDISRSHWGCENCQHYVLDVVYGQDMMRAKNRNYIRNFMLLNKIALNTARVAQEDYKAKDKTITVSRIKQILTYDIRFLGRSLAKSILMQDTQEAA